MKNKSLGLYNIIDTEGINKSINNVLSSSNNFNTYTSPKGLKELRMQISNFLYNIWNYNVNYKDMLITTGSQQSINLIVYSLLNEGCRKFAFKTIAASGINATVLHYNDNDCNKCKGEN